MQGRLINIKTGKIISKIGENFSQSVLTLHPPMQDYEGSRD